MKKDFETFYEELDKNELESAWKEAVKEKNKKKKIATRIIGILDGIVVLSIIGILLCTKNINIYYLLSFLPVVIFLLVIDLFIYVVIALAFSKKAVLYDSAFKEKVIEKLLNNFFDDVDYIPKKEMPEKIYEEGKYSGFYNRYYSDDYVDAIINNKYSMKMAEITAQDVETHTDSDGKTHTTTTTVFSGLFAKIDIGKSINNEMRISRNRDGRRKDKLNMDSQEFESYFDVNATDPIIGMQLLTHDIMDLLVDFRKVFKESFDILIRDNVMYIRLHVGSMFEGKIHQEEIIDKMLVREYSRVLDFINTLAKKMIKVVEETEL